MVSINDFTEVTPYIWEIPKNYRKDMRAPARIYADRTMLLGILEENDRSVEQLINVATLPGIEPYAFAMPDIHQGYGFPIGGVAPIRTRDGVISPGGVGYDINCGVRVLVTPFSEEDVKDKIEDLATQMQRDIPSGVGRGGEFKLNEKELDKVLNKGANWALESGYATETDLEVTEEHGRFRDANAGDITDHAKKRGSDQLGTIGSGNHFVEIQVVTDIYDEKLAESFGLEIGQVVIMIHTGSRGLGHQTCTDFVRLMNSKIGEYNIRLPDRELCCAPFRSPEGQSYFRAMAAAANFAWTNRQLITHQIRKAWEYVLKSEKAGKLRVLYDVAHNIAKKEKHNGKEFIVHRKGATRAFGPGSKDIPACYQHTGQPVLIPGSMGTYSYILVGTEEGMKQTFGSACHGAGRALSRMKAKKTLDYNKLRRDLSDYGVVVRAGSKKGLLEEAPQAYKNVNNVVNIVSESHIANTVARLKPIAVIKG